MSASIARAADARSSQALPVLHLDRISEPDAVLAILAKAQASGAQFLRGMNRRIHPEVARIERITESEIVFEVENFEEDNRDRLFLNLDLGATVYFLEAPVIERVGERLRTQIPDTIFRSERRSRDRKPAAAADSSIALRHPGAHVPRARVLDTSNDGLAVELESLAAESFLPGTPIELEPGAGDLRFGTIRNATQSATTGWTRLGIETGPAAFGHVRQEIRATIQPQSFVERAGQALRISIGGAQLAFDRAFRRFTGTGNGPEPQVVEIKDQLGRPIRGIIDSYGPAARSIAIVIPPAWGRTKETLMPLAVTVVECFKRAGIPVTVLRFDGINRRGESFREDGRGPDARDQSRFTFSQGVEDIRTVVDFLHRDTAAAPSKTFIVSFSAASIEARRAVAEDSRVDGWVCVVGSADAQSMMRSISGGIDYARGLERGASFGMQEILGVSVDMDLAGNDALAKGLVYLGDARRDMASITAPITWIHGEHDAWMDRDRAVRVLACGGTSNRKLVTVPTGHMLKSSREALGVFQLVASEIAEMAVGHALRPAVPNLSAIDRQQHAERSRLPRTAQADIHAFWEDYLLGRDRSIGIDLMTMTPEYERLMLRQIELLHLSGSGHVADFGSGTGAFPHYVSKHVLGGSRLHILELDFVRDGLRRARDRNSGQHEISYVEADLQLDDADKGLPLASESVDHAVASLFLSYVENPLATLAEVRRILRPGGRIVVSSLRRDADMSKLFADAVPYLRENWSGGLSEWAGGIPFETAVRAYLNEASRLLDLEESGSFVFWDADELRGLLRKAGFSAVETHLAFGDPPQAVIAAARRPNG